MSKARFCVTGSAITIKIDLAVAEAMSMNPDDPSVEDFIAVRCELDARDAERELMAQCFENGIRTVERCRVIKSKAGRQYRQRSEYGRGKGKKAKQWDLH